MLALYKVVIYIGIKEVLVMEKETIKTTFNLDKDFHKQLKMASVETDINMKDIIVIAVKEWIEKLNK